jgi:mannose-6-phosphate isomerase-like protein (cupin superfamily)
VTLSRARATAALGVALVAALGAARCRGSQGTTDVRVPEGFGGRVAPRELPEISAADWRSSPAVRRCETGACRVSTGFDDERAPAKMNAWVLEPGTSLRVDADDTVDALAMVVAGRAYASVANPEPRESNELDEQSAITAWTALRSSGQGLYVNVGPSDPPAAVVLVVARDAPASMGTEEVSADSDAAVGDASAGGAKVMVERRALAPQGLQVRRLADVEWLSWGQGAFRAKIAFDGPSARRASFGVLVGGASANVAEHVHERSYELITAVIADGMVNVWGAGEGALGHQNVVRAGDPQVIASGVRHAWVGAGTVPLVAVQAYAPGGPEQRFRALNR